VERIPIMDTAFRESPLGITDDGPKGRLERRSRLRTVLVWGLGSSILALIIGAGLAAFAVLRHGSLAAAIAYLEGYPLAVESYSRSVGEIHAGEPRSATFVLRNLIRKPVTIVGAKTSCGCIATGDLPLTIGAGGEGELTITVRPSERDVGCEYRHTALLYIDVRSPPILLEVTARVLGPGNDSGT